MSGFSSGAIREVGWLVSRLILSMRRLCLASENRSVYFVGVVALAIVA